MKPIKDFWSLHMPRGTYRNNENYYGTFPEGFEKKLKELIPPSSKILHLCSGTSTLGDVRVDINPKSKATHVMDATLFRSDERFDWIIIDPYYALEDYIKAGQKYVSVYDFMKVADQHLKTRGRMAVLHIRPPRKPRGYVLEHLIAISVGPDRQMRCFQIFRKEA